MKQEVILFDINETVLNLASLQDSFSTVLGTDEGLSLWFSKLLHASTVCITTNISTNFAELAATMLESTAAALNVNLSESMRSELLGAFATLPPHSDIKSALSKLREHNFKTVAFSNSSLNLISSQMEHSGLSSFFDEVISVEKTGSFKPDPKVYKFAATILAEPVENLRLVAAHDWDTHGALSVGLKAAFIDRSNSLYNPHYIKPDIEANTMDKIAEKIINMNKER